MAIHPVTKLEFLFVEGNEQLAASVITGFDSLLRAGGAANKDKTRMNIERFHNELAMRLGYERILKDKRIQISYN